MGGVVDNFEIKRDGKWFIIVCTTSFADPKDAVAAKDFLDKLIEDGYRYGIKKLNKEMEVK